MKEQVLVIGGSSHIGRHICDYFSKRGKLKSGTYYKKQMEGLVYLDLKNPNISKLNLNLKEIESAIICSAITNIDECKKNADESYQTNVIGMKKLLNQLFNEGIKPLFFSSDYVFNGERGNYSEEDKTNPCTVYGDQKKTIEDYLLGQKNKEYLIVRISKNFGLEYKDNTMLTTWFNQLLNDETLRCAKDQIFSFTYVVDTVRAISTALDIKLNGLYNIASPKAYSRLELATKLKGQLGIKKGNIVSCLLKDFKFLDNRPMDISLNVNKFIKRTDFKFTSMEECIERLRSLKEKK